MNNKSLIPKISVIVAENKTGNRVATVVTNQILPKTLPIRSLGVTSCKKVRDGIIPTTYAPPARKKHKIAINLPSQK